MTRTGRVLASPGMDPRDERKDDGGVGRAGQHICRDRGPARVRIRVRAGL